MSSFQAYSGVYAAGDRHIRWRCYATAPVHEVRRADHAPLPPPPEGKVWSWRSQRDGESMAAWLLDADCPGLSHMLLQFEPLAAEAVEAAIAETAAPETQTQPQTQAQPQAHTQAQPQIRPRRQDEGAAQLSAGA